MSVRKIQEYIDERIAEAEQELKNHEIHIDIKNHINILDIIKTMLDEVREDRDEDIIAIKLQALDQTLGKNKQKIFTDGGAWEFIHRKIKEIQKDVLNLEKDKKWVDVRDRLPNEFKEYYVTLDNFTEELVEYTQADEDCGEWTIGRWEKINGKPSYEIYDVIAWREKPQPYERKENK